MANVDIIKSIAIKNSATGDEVDRNLGVEAQNAIVSFDEDGNIIEDINEPGVTVHSTKTVAEVLKEILAALN